MKLWLGTSGFQYRDWRGRFYPQELAQSKWLEHYAARFRTCELNNSFYRLPSEAAFAGWRARTPEDFVMVVKASRYLSHLKRLIDPEDPVDLLMGRARHLGPKLGPILLQLPPQMKVELERLDRTLRRFDRWGARVAVEFRHASWDVAEVHEVLRAHGAALCLADRHGPATPVLTTTDWTFLRFHEGDASPWPRYGEAALRAWTHRLLDLGVGEAWVFFNNDPGCWAVANAQAFGRYAERVGVDVTRFPAEPVRVARAA
jgi:uncharacterized protein YecE (DUF72 family)